MGAFCTGSFVMGAIKCIISALFVICTGSFILCSGL
jgi:hypothetical protein